MATLEGCTIKFYTNGAGKEADSRVSVIVRDDNDVVAASVCDDFGHFEASTNNGPFDLAVVNASKKADLRRGRVTIQFEPKGHDVWRFNFFTVLMFSDGTRLNGGKVELELNRCGNEQTFELDALLS
jgi:hypothetical protein